MAVVFSAVVALFALGQVSPVPRETTLGRVLTLADQHKVTSATIQGNSVTVSTVGGTSYSAAQKDTRQLTRELLDHGVTAVAVRAPNPAYAGLRLGIVLLLLLIIAVEVRILMVAVRPGIMPHLRWGGQSRVR